MLKVTGADRRAIQMKRTAAMSNAERKIVVITGATRGLGLAMAEEFAERGHVVLGCGRSRDLVEKIGKKFGADHDWAIIDVSRRDQVDAWASRLMEKFGPPDLILNNAAIVNANSPLWKVPPDEFDAIIDINIKGVYYVIRAFAPAMIERGSGVIVNFSSGWGRSTSPDVASYCATKWAIEGLSKALAQDLPKGLVSVAFNPGIIDTDMLRECFGGDAELYPEPDDWAKLAVPFLLQIGAKDSGKSLSLPGL
jgi:NAD(P)-dependent dehydrogenase (short-subunit alcohol dehydrogenase family)